VRVGVKITEGDTVNEVDDVLKNEREEVRVTDGVADAVEVTVTGNKVGSLGGVDDRDALGNGEGVIVLVEYSDVDKTGDAEGEIELVSSRDRVGVVE
jgi:hypothetical protein